MKHISLILLSATLILSGCKSKKETAASEDQTTVEQEESTPQIQPDAKKLIIDDSFSMDEKPGYSIENIEFEGKLMKIDVSYSGGCEDQTFDLYGSKMYAKSMPPQTTLQLYHDSKGDPCRQLIKETLVFDIEEIQHPSSKTLIIRLKGHTKSYEYTY